MIMVYHYHEDVVSVSDHASIQGAVGMLGSGSYGGFNLHRGESIEHQGHSKHQTKDCHSRGFCRSLSAAVS